MLGAANSNSHNFRIERDASNVFRIYIDGGQLAVSITQNDSRIACWAGGDRGADWLMEKSDYGNAFGEETSKSQFNAPAFKTSSWSTIAATAPCYDGADNDFCTDFANGDFDGWTDNGGTSLLPNPNELVVSATSSKSVGVPWR